MRWPIPLTAARPCPWAITGSSPSPNRLPPWIAPVSADICARAFASSICSRRSARDSVSASSPVRAWANPPCFPCSPAPRASDTVVIALVGERGREVREFLEETLGEARSKAVMVVSTGDESPMMRRLAPNTAMAVAEYFRDRGEKVLMIVDSVTRYAHAARDVALAAGEPAVSRGFPPSVFSDLPRLLERAGPGFEGGGSITGLFSRARRWRRSQRSRGG